MEATEVWNDLAGYLHVKQHHKGLKKLIPSRKRLWCIYDEGEKQLQFFKSPKDAFVKLPLGTLDLQGAQFYFENADAFNFVINVVGKEHHFKADSRELMMDWLRMLRDKVYPDEGISTNLIEKRTKSLDFGVLTEDEALFQKPAQFSMSMSNLDEAPHGSGTRRKRRIFLPWSFRRSTSSSSNIKAKSEVDFSPRESSMKVSESSNSVSNNAVLHSTGNISATGKKWKCKSCASLSSNNDSLGEELQVLTDRIRSLEMDLIANQRAVISLKTENVLLKKDMVVITQDIVSRGEDFDMNIDYNRHCNKILEMLDDERRANQKLPNFRSAMSSIYTDRLGFVHGERESPAQAFHFCCNQLKEHYLMEAKEEELRKKWDEFLEGCNENELHYSKELLQLVVDGVLTDVRPGLWKRLISGKVKHIKEAKGDAYYEELCNHVPSVEDTEHEFDDSIEKQIRIDLLRTMPSHNDFKTFESDGVKKLHRVLRAFIIHNPEIGYCQGMNFMVAIGLLCLSEEDTFWLLVSITEVYFNKNHYNHYLTGSQADQLVLEELAVGKLHNIVQCTKEVGCELSPITFNWLMTLFVDSVPAEVALRIWDCFFVEGHAVLYRFSLALLKMNEDGICSKTDMLTLLKYLKKIGRQVFDADFLLELAYTGFEPFPPSDVLTAMYEKHFTVIQEVNDKREKQEKEYQEKKKSKRMQPHSMRIRLAEDLDGLPEDFMIECCESEANANKIWLCCSTHNLGQLFVLDIVNGSLEFVKGSIKSRCLCLARSSFSKTMIVGTADATMHGFDVETREEIWSLQVDDSVSSISCDGSGNIVATLASGSIAVAQQDGETSKPSRPMYLHIGHAPVVCGCIINDYFWCGCGNNIVIMDLQTFDEVESIQVCPNLRHSISKLIVSDIGIWCSVRGSSVLQLFDKKSFACIMTTDVMDESGLASEKISHLNSTRITAILPRRNEVWIGLGNGRFLIFEIKKGPKPPPDSSDSSSTANITEEILPDVNDEEKESPASQPMDIISSAPTCCHETLIKKNSNNVSSFSLGDSGFVFVSRLSGSVNQLEPDDRFHIVLKQLQRISEDAVRCLLCVRNDYKQILSCVGAINDEMSIVLWSCERRQGREMWYAQTVTYST